MSKIINTEQKIEKAVVNGYKAIENGFVNGYKKIEGKFINTFLTPDNDSYAIVKPELKQDRTPH